MKGFMLVGLSIGLALSGCAAEPPATSDVEITSVGAPTPLTPPAPLAASIRAPGLPTAAYRSALAPSAINNSYHPSWPVDIC
jgi:hypothetical protein